VRATLLTSANNNLQPQSVQRENKGIDIQPGMTASEKIKTGCQTQSRRLSKSIASARDESFRGRRLHRVVPAEWTGAIR
jgi:hypothetical protein